MHAEGPEAKTPKEIEAMYAVVSEEHKEKKKLAKLCIQQYDDINLVPLDREEGEQNGNGSKLLASVTVEGDSTGYSRLQHAGPRMSQTRRHMFSVSGGADQPTDDGKRNGPSANTTKDLSYSEVRPTGNPSSELTAPMVITGGYSVINQSKEDDDVPPPLPQRVSMCVDPSYTGAGVTEPPAQFHSKPSTGTAEGGGPNYSVVGKGEPSTTNTDFFDEQFLSDFGNKKPRRLGEQLYDSVK